MNYFCLVATGSSRRYLGLIKIVIYHRKTYEYNIIIYGHWNAGTDFIALIVLLLFGGKKIPELMKGLGKGVKSFKDGMNGVEESLKDNTPTEDTKK